MTISQIQLAQELSKPEIKKFWLGYFQESLREAVHQELLEQYENLRAINGFTRSELAAKIGRRPEQVTRWLSSPTNLEVDTISDMGLGMGLIPKISFQSINSLFEGSRPNQGNDLSDYVETHSVPVATSGELHTTNSNTRKQAPIAGTLSQVKDSDFKLVAANG